MKIGVNTLFMIPGEVGGTETYVRQILKAMVSNNSYQSFVFFTSRDNESVLKSDLSEYSNIKFYRLPLRSASRPLRIIFEQIILPWFIWKSRIDVLWSPGYTSPLWSHCPRAVTIHDLQYKSHPEDLNLLERITLDLLIRIAFLTCNAIITVSQFSKRELLRFKLGLAKNIFVVPEGVDPRFRKTAHSKSLSHSGFSTETPYILCVANTYPHKKVHVLVKAFDMVAAEIPHHLILVGKSRRGEILLRKSLVKSRNKKRIHRYYFLPENDLHAVYQNADLFVLPSVYEGFGLPVMEAMMAEVPVIATRQASLPEIGGSNIAYVEKCSPVDFAVKIRELINMNKRVRQRRIERAQTWAASFTWKKSAERTLEILKSLVN